MLLLIYIIDLMDGFVDYSRGQDACLFPQEGSFLVLNKISSKQPLVYACSGCSSAAQLANDIALHLDRKGSAEMSCISGVGGDVKPLVRTAKSGRPIIALDGCKLHCVKSCLGRHGISAKWHISLAEYGVKKKLHCPYEPTEISRILDIVEKQTALG